MKESRGEGERERVGKKDQPKIRLEGDYDKEDVRLTHREIDSIRCLPESCHHV